MTRTHRLVVTAALPALLLTGCSLLSSDKDEAAGPSPIVIGVLAPTKGATAAGASMRDAAQLAVLEINARGGVNGRKVKLAVQDDSCEPKKAADAAGKLIAQHAVAVIAGGCPQTGSVVAEALAKGDVAVLNVAPGLVKSAKSAPNVFLLNGDPQREADTAVGYLDRAGAKRIAVVSDGETAGTALADQAETVLKRAGGPRPAGRHELEGSSAATVKAVVGSSADAVFWTGAAEPGGRLVRALRAGGFDGRVLVGQTAADPAMISAAGRTAAQGVLATALPTADRLPDAQAWITSYTAAYRAAPGAYATQSYDAVRVVAEAIRAAGSTDGSKVIAAVAKTNGLNTLGGTLTFTPEHTRSDGGYVVLEVAQGVFTLADSLR